MHSSKDFLQAGIAAPVVILLLAAVIGVGVGGFVIFNKKGEPPQKDVPQVVQPSQPETPTPQKIQASPTKAPTLKASPVQINTPFIGIWKVDKQYVYGRDSKQWFENQAVIDESQRYLRFTQQGTLCKGMPSTQGFICADKEEKYEVSGDLILIPNVPSSRIKWSMSEGKLELIYELPVQGQLEPGIRYILIKHVSNE